MSTSARRTRRMIVGGAAVSFALAACGGGTDVTSSPAATTPTTGAPTTTAPSAPASTTPSTSPSTSPTTTPPTTNEPPTTPPATTVPRTIAPATTVPTNDPATAFVAADDQLLEVDVATGDTVRVVDESLGAEGVFRGGLRLGPDRSTIWFSEGYEDGWFTCESSVGSFGRIDVATGTAEVLGAGTGVEPSADGESIVYLTSGLCLPDPDEPASFVLTPNDRVVVRRLATGEEREFVTDSPPDGYDAPGAVVGAAFGPDGGLFVSLGDGRLFDVDIDGSGVIQDHPVVVTEMIGTPVAATADAVVTVEFGDEGSTDVFSVALDTGEATLLASSESFMAVGVGPEGQIVVSSYDAVTVAPGARVTVVELPGGPSVSDIDW